MKRGIRILGVDDAPFQKADKQVLVIGVVWRNGIVEGVVSTKVEKDGSDSTDKIIAMAKNSRFGEGIRLIMLHSLTLAGFNLVDLKRLSGEAGVPVIALVRKKPDAKDVENALRKLPGFEEKMRLVEKAGKFEKIAKGLYGQFAGISLQEAREAVRAFGFEPVRLAHIIASGVGKGESKGRM